MKEIANKIAEVQERLDGITKDGFWFYITFPEGDRLDLLPHTLEVLDARPVLGRDGKIVRWRVAVLMIERGFAEFGASVHGHHLHVIERIKWVRGGSGRIYAAYLYEAPGGVKIHVNELDGREYPDEKRAWREHAERLAVMPERASEALEMIRDEYRPMAEAALRG